MTDQPLDPHDIEGLAAEHALGSLSPGERAEVARRLPTDRRLAEAIAAWERRLAPLSHREPGLPPPPGALEGLLTGLAHQTGAAQAMAAARLRRSLGRWRTAAVGFGAIAAALALAVPLAITRQAPAVRYAVLAAGPGDAADEAAMAGRPMFLALADAAGGSIALRQVSGRPPPGERVYVLWLADRDNRIVRRIGALDRDERRRSFTLDATAPEGAMVVLTVEARAPTEAPAGPVVASGRLMRAEP